MTTTPELPVSGATTKPPAAPPGAFDRLSAFDGLFLRAEHINLIENYAADLAFAIGSSTGPGIVYGFDVSLADYELRVSVGLALMADGRPVRTTAVLSAPIDDLELKAGRYFEVGLKWGSWSHGEEAVQGLLCDTPCASDGGTRRTAREYEGPYLVIEPVDRVTALAEQVTAHRSWLASQLFRQEEKDQDRRLRTALPRQWPSNTPERPRGFLPLAVLLPPMGGRDWQVDQWSVRRDRGAPPPARYWEWQLGMRPRDVFIAQVLQFQVQLSEIEPTQTFASRVTNLRGDLQALVKSMREVDEPSSRQESDQKPDEIDQRVSAVKDDLLDLLETSADQATASPGPELVELPSAGFVPRSDATLETVAENVEKLLACPGYVRRVYTCAPGDIGARFAAAQHRDRTPTPRSSPNPPMVGVLDVFVPVVDREVVYDWVLFTRTEQVEPAQATPVVPAEESVMVKADIDESVRELGTLTYPERAWQVPDDDGSVIAQVRDLIATRAVRTVQADVDSDERRPLGYLRATLLAATFVDDRPTELPPVETTVTADRPEAITIVFGDAAPNVAERNSGRSTATATSKASATRPAAKSAPTAAKAPTRSRRSAAKSAAGKSAGAAAKRGSTSKSASPKTERR